MYQRKNIVVPYVGSTGEKHDHDASVPVILEYIRDASVIISDSWTTYRSLKDYGYTLHMVNHSKNNVNPDNS